MTKKKQPSTVVNKIEYDANSKEPIIVQISEEEYLQQRQKETPHPDTVDFVKLKTQKGSRAKQAAKEYFGINKQQSVSHRQKIFKGIATAVFIIFVLGTLAYTAYSDFAPGENKVFPSIEELGVIFSNNWYYFLLSFVALACTFLFKGLKISLMCKSMTGSFHFKTSLETAIVGAYYNNVTPLAVGGQPFEIYHLSKHGVHGGVASSIPIATFFLNQLAFVILSIIALIMYNANTLGMSSELLHAVPPAIVNVVAIIGLVCCLFMPLLVVTFSMLPTLGSKLVHLVMFLGAKLRIIKNPEETTKKTIETVVHNSHCLKKIATSPLLFFSTFMLSFLEHIANASIAFFCLKTFGYPAEITTSPSIAIEWLQIISLCLILYASISFIPTPGNSGAADLSFFLLFTVGLVPGLAFPAMVSWRIMSFYSILIIGFVFASLKKRSDAKNLAEQIDPTPLELLDNQSKNE